MDREQIDAGFEAVRMRRQVAAHMDDIRSADFWRALNPALTISARPFAAPVPRRRVDAATAARAAAQLLEDGYLEAPAVVIDEEAARLRDGIRRVVDAGFPPNLACVYDEFYRTFHGLEDLISPILGRNYRMVLQGVSAFCVPPGDAGYGTTGAIAPHRDTLGPDPAVLAGELPAVLAVWIPLVDVTPLDSCLYVLPAPYDRGYTAASDAEREVRADWIRLQDVRALPARAGTVLAWSPHLIHWGSRSSRWADGPRVAVSVYLQRGDVPPFHPSIVGFDEEVGFERRLDWIDQASGSAGLFPRASA